MTDLQRLALSVSSRATSAEVSKGTRPFHLPLNEEEAQVLKAAGLYDEVMVEGPEGQPVAVVEVLLNRAGL